MSRKRGKLAKSEEDFIKQNVHDLSLQELADSINRTTETVEKFIRNNNIQGVANIIDDKEYKQNLLLKQLRERVYYPGLSDMLTESELTRFEIDWIEVMLQFQENVKYTEEIQVKQWILLHILTDRSMKNRKDAMKDYGDIQKQLDEELAKEEDFRDKALISSLNQQIGYARESMIAFTREHASILEKIEKVEKGLKATRQDRVKRIEDSKESWQGYLRMMEKEDVRQNAGEDAEIKRLAKNAARERLSAWHKYEDGKVDQPLLTPEGLLDEFDKPEEDDYDE